MKNAFEKGNWAKIYFSTEVRYKKMVETINSFLSLVSFVSEDGDFIEPNWTISGYDAHIYFQLEEQRKEFRKLLEILHHVEIYPHSPGIFIRFKEEDI